MPKRTLLIPLALVAGLVSASLMLGATEGAFSAVTSNSGNSFQAASSFCPAQTALAEADTYVREDLPNFNDGDDAAFQVATEAPGKNVRALVRFAPLPATPADCTVTSVVLRVYSIPGYTTLGRTLEALRVTSPWTEMAATWSNQPSSTFAGRATRPSAVGDIDFDVTAQYAAVMADNNGFLLRDSIEDEGALVLQNFWSRGGPSHPPKLIVTYAATP